MNIGGTQVFPDNDIEERVEDDPIKVHKLKINEGFAEDVYNGRRNFDIRFNDRGYQAGDLIKYTVVDKHDYPCTDHLLSMRTYQITYVLSGYGLKDNYVAFGIKRY